MVLQVVNQNFNTYPVVEQKRRDFGYKKSYSQDLNSNKHSCHRDVSHSNGNLKFRIVPKVWQVKMGNSHPR